MHCLNFCTDILWFGEAVAVMFVNAGYWRGFLFAFGFTPAGLGGLHMVFVCMCRVWAVNL